MLKQFVSVLPDPSSTTVAAPSTQDLEHSSAQNSISSNEDNHVEIVDKEGVHKDAERLQLTSFDIWALGVCITCVGEILGWNGGLAAGTGGFFLLLGIMCIGYSCLMLCVAEISSALPFAGK